MRKLFKEKKLFKGGNNMRKYGKYFTLVCKNVMPSNTTQQVVVSQRIAHRRIFKLTSLEWRGVQYLVGDKIFEFRTAATLINPLW